MQFNWLENVINKSDIKYNGILLYHNLASNNIIKYIIIILYINIIGKLTINVLGFYGCDVVRQFLSFNLY